MTAPYPTVPYPGFIDYNTTLSSDSLVLKLDKRDISNNSNTVQLHSSSSTHSVLSTESSRPVRSIRIKASAPLINQLDSLTNELEQFKVDNDDDDDDDDDDDGGKIQLGDEKIIKFNKIKDYAILDYQQGMFTPEVQYNWIKALFEYSCDKEFLTHFNINGEKLKTPLSDADIITNERIFTKQAIKLLKKLTKSEFSEGIFTLGCLYSNSPNLKVCRNDLLEKNYSKSFEYYYQASRLGHKDAMYRLAVSYEVGAGVKKDDLKAFNYFEKSAVLGSVQSMFKLGLIYLKGGLGVKRNAKKCYYWLNLASAKSDEENPYSFYELGKLYEYDFQFNDPNFINELIEIGVVQNDKKSLDYYKKAAILKYSPAQCKLGWCYEYGKLGCEINAKKSIGWYSRAAKSGNCMAEMALSGWYLTGAKGILNQNDKEAFLWALKSAENGFAKAEYALGYYYEVGLGCDKNMEKSMLFYKRAASKGHEKAVNKLREMIR